MIPTRWVKCPVCGRDVTKHRTGTLQRHKAKPKWGFGGKILNQTPSDWCAGGGVQEEKKVGLKANQALAEQYPILQFFKYAHLPEELQKISAPFNTLAWKMARVLPRNAETSTMLRKLLEAKDCAVRSALDETSL
jgi:hypothetical protein